MAVSIFPGMKRKGYLRLSYIRDLSLERTIARVNSDQTTRVHLQGQQRQLHQLLEGSSGIDCGSNFLWVASNVFTLCFPEYLQSVFEYVSPAVVNEEESLQASQDDRASVELSCIQYSRRGSHAYGCAYAGQSL